MFKIHRVNRSESKIFSESALKINYKQEEYPHFFSLPFSIENIEKQILIKNKHKINREALYSNLKKQYLEIETISKVYDNIEKLQDENTFTFCTGHQLCLLTGPFYFIIKILHTIKLCESAKLKFPNYNFVPIYWMASEDHDFDEISSINIFRDKINWEKDVKNIPIGNIDNEGIKKVIQSIELLYKNNKTNIFDKINSFFSGNNYSVSFFKFINFLFQEYGLVIIDANKKEFKELAKAIFIKEIKESFSKKSIEEWNKKLLNDNFEITVNPRNINLFYLENNKRYRIEKENEDFFLLLDGKEIISRLTKDELLKNISINPEKISPNVVLRPIFQELILPNLAYIGGSNEIQYWLQLKNTFEILEIPFPLLQIRNSVLIIDQNTSKKIKKLGLDINDFLSEKENIIQNFIDKNKSSKIDFSEIKTKLRELKNCLTNKISEYDSGLISFAESENTKLEKIILSIENQLLKKEKTKFDIELQQIKDIKNKLFPEGSFQERFYNIFNFCPDADIKTFINFLYENIINVLEKDLIICELDN